MSKGPSDLRLGMFSTGPVWNPDADLWYSGTYCQRGWRLFRDTVLHIFFLVSDFGMLLTI